MPASSAATAKPRHSTTETLAAEMFAYETAYREEHPGCRIAGVDEAGRGPLAGPVVAAAVILPADGSFTLPVADSKALTAARREELFAALHEEPGVLIGVAIRDAACIDRINILRATHEAMREAVRSLSPLPDAAFVDGLAVRDFPVEARFIVKGDAHSASIAAASIIAKVTRDHIMEELDRQYPLYGFAIHKGYGTAEHLRALEEHGPCPVHRMTFGPVARILHPPMQQPTFL